MRARRWTFSETAVLAKQGSSTAETPSDCSMRCDRAKRTYNCGGFSRRSSRGSRMRRTGNTIGALCAVLAATAASAAPEVRAEADRSEVGLLDTFVLTVRASEAPRGSDLQLPPLDGV